MNSNNNLIADDKHLKFIKKIKIAIYVLEKKSKKY